MSWDFALLLKVFLEMHVTGMEVRTNFVLVACIFPIPARSWYTSNCASPLQAPEFLKIFHSEHICFLFNTLSRKEQGVIKAENFSLLIWMCWQNSKLVRVHCAFKRAKNLFVGWLESQSLLFGAWKGRFFQCKYLSFTSHAKKLKKSRKEYRTTHLLWI